MKVILSTGPQGRIHLIQSVYWLHKKGIVIRFIIGWAPRLYNTWFIRWCSKITGKNLTSEIKIRRTNNSTVETKQCACTEILLQICLMACRRFTWLKNRIILHGWKLFGFCSRRHIKNADIFHVRSGAGQGGAIRCARKRGMKILTDHSMAHPGYIEKHLRNEYDSYNETMTLTDCNPFYKLVVKDCMDADMLMVNSFFVRDTFNEMGFPEKRIRVVYLGTRSDFFSLRKKEISNNGIQLLFTGNFMFHKGAAYILKALKILKERGNTAMQMDVVGDYQGAYKLINLFQSDKLPITFHGRVPQDDLKKYLQNADIYVFPSLAEGCASSGMEAMAAGLCVVATRESGLPITDGETGFIVPSKNALAIADKLEWLQAHPNEINRVGANAAKLIATEYTWEKYAEGVERIYHELLE